MVKDKHLADLMAVTQPLEKAAANPADIISGWVMRSALNVVAPSFLRELDKFGIAPGECRLPTPIAKS